MQLLAITYAVQTLAAPATPTLAPSVETRILDRAGAVCGEYRTKTNTVLRLKCAQGFHCYTKVVLESQFAIFVLGEQQGYCINPYIEGVTVNNHCGPNSGILGTAGVISCRPGLVCSRNGISSHCVVE